jgi:hypothetical protein
MIAGPAVYRAKAHECEQQAREAHDPEIKAQLQQLADRWRELADQVERMTR